MKKTLALILASLMVISLFAGCAGGEESAAESKAEESKAEESQAEESKAEESQAEESQAEESADAPAATEEENGATFYVEGTRVTDDEVTLTCMQSISDAHAIVLDGLWWVDHLYEVTGVKIDYSQVNSSDYATQLNLTFASGEYPDLFVNSNMIDREMYGVDQGILREFNDVLDYMPTYKERLEGDPIAASPLYASNGKMYAMGCIGDDGGRIGSPNFFINKKWLDEAGLEIPETTDELLDALRAFKAADPNRLGYEAVFDEMTQAIFCCFGIPEIAQHIMVDEDYNVIFTPFMENYRGGVELLAQMFAEGLMDPSNITQDGNSKTANYNTNNVGLVTCGRLRSMGWDVLVEDMTFMIPPHAEGCEVMIGKTAAAANGKAYMSVTNPYPKITARWLDAQLDNQLTWESWYGPQGVIWDFNDEGKCQLGPEGDQGSVEYALNTNGIYYMPGYMYCDVFQQPDYRLERLGYQEIYNEQGLFAPVSYAYATSLAKFAVDDTNERVEIYANIESIYDSAVADMIMHGVTDDNWNDMIDHLKEAGAERYVEIYDKGVKDYVATLG